MGNKYGSKNTKILGAVSDCIPDFDYNYETKTVTILKEGYYKLGPIFTKCKPGEMYTIEKLDELGRMNIVRIK